MLFISLMLCSIAMPYSKAKLDSFLNNKLSPEFSLVVQELADKVFANELLSLAEENFIGGIIEIMQNENGTIALNITDYPSCKNYMFRNRYLIYHNDLNGNGKIKSNEGIIPRNQVVKDIEYLQRQFIEWKEIIHNKLSGNQLINYVAQESNYQLKKLQKYSNNNYLTQNQKDYYEKYIVLHGKYIYLLVKEFFQELGKKQIVIELNGNNILIDSFTYVHTMFRHFAKKFKVHQFDKSYHFDKNIGFYSIPNFLSKTIYQYKALQDEVQFNSKSLSFIFNNQHYTIWFRPLKIHIKGGKVIQYLRVQTFYPVKDFKQLIELSKLRKVQSESEILFLL